MDKNSQEFKNLIYDLANGSLDLEHFPVAESKYVENVSIPGSGHPQSAMGYRQNGG